MFYLSLLFYLFSFSPTVFIVAVKNLSVQLQYVRYINIYICA